MLHPFRDNDLQLPLLHWPLPVGSFSKGVKTLLRAHILLSIFITASDPVSNVARKGPPALYLKSASSTRAQEMSVSVLSKTQLGVARLHLALDASPTPASLMKALRK